VLQRLRWGSEWSGVDQCPSAIGSEKSKSANQIHVNAMEEFSEVIQEETARALRDFVLSVFTKASLC
jgi:hypothetical protein